MRNAPTKAENVVVTGRQQHFTEMSTTKVLESIE